MTDVETQDQLKISTDGDAGPYLMLPLQQLDDVLRLLKTHGVTFSVDDDAILLDGRPAIAIVNFGRDTDPRQLQRLLDAA